MEKFNKIKEFIAELEPDVVKFYEKGFSTTGTRVTVGMQELKDLAHELRADVLARKKELETIKEAEKVAKRRWS